MKYQFVSINPLYDINYSSGMPYFMSQAFREVCKETIFTDNLKVDVSLFLKYRAKLQNKFFRKKFALQRELSVADGFAKQVHEAILVSKPDAIVCTSSIPIAQLDCNTPVIFWTDATFAGMVGFYDSFSSLCKRSLKNGNALEKSALDRCKFAVYSSQWAADTAATYYNIPQSKLHVVPFGANIENPKSFQDIKKIIQNRSRSQCNILFIAKGWQRKRGDFAIEVVDFLNKSGLPTRLFVIGVEKSIKNNNVEVIGHLDKSKKRDIDLFNKIMIKCHFLLLPTTADTTPNVIPEANSFGIPVICTNIGGISSVIKKNVNGTLFDLKSSPSEYAQYIIRFFSNYAAYQELALSSYGQFETRLNWKKSVSTVKELISNYI